MELYLTRELIRQWCVLIKETMGSFKGVLRDEYENLLIKLYLFYNDYQTNYTTYINHASWHCCLRSDGLRVGRNRSVWRKPTCLTWWPHDHLTCRRRVSNLGHSCEKNCCWIMKQINPVAMTLMCYIVIAVTRGGVAQWVARLTRNVKVVG